MYNTDNLRNTASINSNMFKSCGHVVSVGDCIVNIFGSLEGLSCFNNDDF